LKQPHRANDNDGSAVTFGAVRRGLGGLRPHPCSPHPSTASVPTSYYSMWRYNYLCTLTG